MPESDIVIDVRALVKRFATQTVLDGISMQVRRGETVAVLGRSGTGKSVLLKTIIGLMDPDGGEVLVNGRRFSDLSERDRLAARSELTYVFQGAALFDSLSVADNVGFPLLQRRLPADEIRSRVEEALATVGLAEAIDKYPSELSGGMQKRVGLARSIINRPSVILYDEPTTGLDPLTTDVINQIILRLQRGSQVTAMVVTHDMDSAFTIADRIVMLEQGRIVAAGTPDEIKSHANSWVQRFIRGDSGGGSGIHTRPIVATRTAHHDDAGEDPDLPE
jgi:phospholipid/cholesterol/gamma-HCH transport system ATP-binding protein